MMCGFKQHSFTLIELLVVISILSILLGLVIPSYHRVREQARNTNARVVVKNLETAFKEYLQHYGTWPSVVGTDETQIHPIQSDLYNILQGEKVGSDNSDQIAFFEFGPIPEMESPPPLTPQTAYDPWGNTSDRTTFEAYRVMFDVDYDNNIKFGGVDIYRSVLVWSYGSDRIHNTDDDIKSWE